MKRHLIVLDNSGSISASKDSQEAIQRHLDMLLAAAYRERDETEIVLLDTNAVHRVTKTNWTEYGGGGFHFPSLSAWLAKQPLYDVVYVIDDGGNPPYPSWVRHINAAGHLRDLLGPPDIQQMLTNKRRDAVLTSIQVLTNPVKAEEAPRMSSTPASVVTSVRLQAGWQNGQYVNTVGDLRRLIDEVERVGGSDESTWAFDSNRYNYTVEVVAHTVTAPQPLTDAERVALLTEIVGGGLSEERNREVRGLLGLTD